MLTITLASACASSPPSIRVPPAPEIPRDRPLVVAFLIVDGVYDTELTGPLDIFHHTPFHTKSAPGMTVYTVSPGGQPATSFEGLRFVPDPSLETAAAPDVLVVPSAEHSMDSDLEDERLIEWVRTKGEQARFVMSLCGGAFVLAKAGLLDGKTSTTSPSVVLPWPMPGLEATVVRRP